jgi:hypothetical protein
MEAGADRIQRYPFPCTPIMEITDDWIFNMLSMADDEF